MSGSFFFNSADFALKDSFHASIFAGSFFSCLGREVIQASFKRAMREYNPPSEYFALNSSDKIFSRDLAVKMVTPSSGRGPWKTRSINASSSSEGRCLGRPERGLSNNPLNPDSL